MAYNPHSLFGSLNDNDLQEYNDTGVVLTSFDVTPRLEKQEKRGHSAADGPTPASYRQIKQVQHFIIALDMEAKMETVASSTGTVTGLAAVTPSQVITFANFSSGDEIHGFVKDDTKLLLAGEVKQTRSPEKATEITLPATYYPKIAAPV